MKFSDKYIQSLKPKDKRYDLREKSGNGLAIRISPQTYSKDNKPLAIKKTWIYFYTLNGKKRRMTLGDYPALTLSEARKIHRKALTLVEKDIDPIHEKQKKADELLSSKSVNQLINEYITHWAIPHKRSWKADKRCLEKDVAPIWGKQKAKDITRRDVIVLLDKIKDRGAPIAANRTLACVRRMFNFAIERDFIQTSPCVAVKPVGKENRRDRVLSTGEIHYIWHELTTAKMSEQTTLALKLQLVTAQRKGEIISAEWNEIDTTNGWWTIPANKAKNGHSHRVFLSELALHLLDVIKLLSRDSRWLFPAPTSKMRSFAIKLQSIMKNCKGNILLAKWDEINLETKAWLAITDATTNTINHISLPSKAIEILHEIRSLTKKTQKSKSQNLTGFIFKSYIRKGVLDTHITGASIDHAVRRNKFKDVNPWVPHDLRRSAASHMTSMGISRLTVSKILNHVDSSITAVYDRYSYDNEKRRALEAWSDMLTNIIYKTEESNVIAFDKAI